MSVAVRRLYRDVSKVLRRADSRSNRGRVNREALTLMPSLIGGTGGRSWSNCWGTTLHALGGQERLRFVDCEDMDRWLSLNTRSVVKPAFGDVLVVRADGVARCSCMTERYEPKDCGGLDCELDDWDAAGTLSHTALYVGEGLYWHQIGAGGMFRLDTLEAVKLVYPGTYEHVRKLAS